MRQALLIIDVQNDYFTGGKMSLDRCDEALNNTIKLQRVFRQQNKPIFYIQHIKKDPKANFFARGSKGADLHQELLPIHPENEQVIIKHYPNSFKDTIWQSALNSGNIEQLVICGMMTHMCIDSTTRAAAELGYTPILIADACATKDLVFQTNMVNAQAVQNAFLAALTNFSQIIDTEKFLLL